MTKLLVHGIPETAAIWSLLVPALERRGVDDLVMLSPPGFGAPAPQDFPATAAAYTDWLTGEIARLDGPIDLFGHDMGAGITFGVAADHPELVRSWTTDIAGLLHRDYEWHEAAANWQQPDVGEAAMDFMLALGDEGRAAVYADLGLPPEIAEPVARGFDADMARCILGFYRSAVHPALPDLADRLAAAPRRPSLLIAATEDAYVPAELTSDVAARLGSSVLTLDGLGHWWMVSDPDAAADGLVAFWNGLD